MDFPKRIKQHKSQSDSFAILLYRLRDLGIFRSATENYYGIDFEIEIIHEDKVIGRYLKAQVKGAEDLYIREDGIPTVGGIKQSTLLYWTELSFRTHVIAFAVDLKTEKIYFTKSIFWQATCLLDNTDKSKTIEFIPAVELPDSVKEKSGKKMEKLENFVSTLAIKKIAFESSTSDTIYAHKTLLRNIKQVIELYSDSWWLDFHMEVQLLDTFKTVLECGKILIGMDLPEQIDGLEPNDRKNLFDFEYWVHKSELGGEDVTNYISQIPLKIIIPLLLNKLQYFNKLVLKGAYYWMYKDLPYLKLVYLTEIPNEREHEKILKIKFDDSYQKESFHDFLWEIKEKNKKIDS